MDSKDKGMDIFLDVFRRADKNDDNALSLEEFKSFFNDGVMSGQQLEVLFHEIDTHSTNNLDTGELCTYFSKHLGSFKQVFDSLASLNESVNQAINDTAQTYPQSGGKDKFVTRFLLREILNQLAALQRPVESASDHLDAAALRAKAADTEPQSPDGTKSTVPGWVARRARRQISSQTSVLIDSGSLAVQVDRLKEMIDRLENKVNIAGVSDEQLDITEENLMLIVQRKMHVQEKSEDVFRNSLRSYVEALNASENCEHIHVRSYSGSNLFVIYEIWEDEEAWKSHLSTETSKKFSHSNIDCLERPENCSTMPVPASWLRCE